MNRAATLSVFLLLSTGVTLADPSVTKLELEARTADGKRIALEVLLPGDAKGPVPVIFVSHGWTDLPSSFEPLAEHYASHGMAAVLVDQPSRQEIDIHRWVSVMRSAIDEVESQAKAPEGPLSGKLDLEKIGIEGHSYGGATAIMTAAEDSRIKAVVALAPGAPPFLREFYEASARVAVPLQIQGGQLDTVLPVKVFARAAYERAASAPSKQYLELARAHHLAWSDNPLLRPMRIVASIVPSFFTSKVFLDYPDAFELSVRYSTAWFEEKLGLVKDRSAVLGKRSPGLSDYRSVRSKGLTGVLEDQIQGAATDEAPEDP